MHIKIDSLYEQQWPHPGMKSGHMLHLQYHQGPLGTVCLQQDSDHVCLWPGYHLHHITAKHDYSGVVKESTREWNGTLLSSMLRVGSVCMRVKDVHVYGIDLVNVILQGAFAHDTQAPSQASWCGRGHQLQLVVTFGVSPGKVNSACYIPQVVNPMLLVFLRQEGGVLFQ